MASDKDAAKVIGACAGLVVYLFLVGPIWFILLYTILAAIQAPTYAWVLYWIYMPAAVLGAVVRDVVQDIGY